MHTSVFKPAKCIAISYCVLAKKYAVHRNKRKTSLQDSFTEYKASFEMVVLTDSSENLHEVRAIEERQSVLNNVMEVFHDRHADANKNDDVKVKMENEKNTVAKHMKNVKNDELNNDATDPEKEKVHRDTAEDQLQEEHCSTVSTEGASERLLKYRANSLDLHQKESFPDDECSADTEEDSQSTKEEDGLPIDKGWAWVILLGMCSSYSSIQIFT